jgi:hypothetical protein
LQTAHGEYPIYPPRGDAIVEVFHSGCPIYFRMPPITIAAKLIDFSRRETIPLVIPDDIPDDRAAAIAQNNNSSLTKADIIEVNSHVGAQFVDASDWE